MAPLENEDALCRMHGAVDLDREAMTGPGKEQSHQRDGISQAPDHFLESERNPRDRVAIRPDRGAAQEDMLIDTAGDVAARLARADIGHEVRQASMIARLPRDQIDRSSRKDAIGHIARL